MFVKTFDPYFGLIELDEVRLARLGHVDFACFLGLVVHHAGAGRGLYAAFDRRGWSDLAAREFLDETEADPTATAGPVAVAEIAPRVP